MLNLFIDNYEIDSHMSQQQTGYNDSNSETLMMRTVEINLQSVYLVEVCTESFCPLEITKHAD
jgi:hypothetical protein